MRLRRGRHDLFPRDTALWLRATVTLVIGLACSVLVLAGLVWWWTTQWIDGLFATAYLVCGWRVTAKAVVRATTTGPELERVIGHVDRLSMLAGIPPPRVRLIAGSIPLSWTTALPSRQPMINITTSMERLCDEAELQAVLAHELGHLIHRDAWVMTIVGGPPTWMLTGIRAMAHRDTRGKITTWLFGGVGLLALPGALTARIVSRQRELTADRAAAILTGSPAAVAAALMHISGSMHGIPRRDLRSVAGGDLFHFLPARQTEPRGLANLWATHPPIKRRLAQLERMERRLQHGDAQG